MLKRVQEIKQNFAGKMEKDPQFKKDVALTAAVITTAFCLVLVFRRYPRKGYWSFGIDRPVKVRLTDTQAAAFNRYQQATNDAEMLDDEKAAKAMFKRLTRRADRKLGEKISSYLNKEEELLRDKGVPPEEIYGNTYLLIKN